MNRLTKKAYHYCDTDIDNEYTFADEDVSTGEIVDKLGNLEDLGEQIGCPLEVREKAFDNGFYDADGNHYFCEHYVPYLKEMHTRGIMSHTEKRFKLKDYKKTWFLRKDKRD